MTLHSKKRALLANCAFVWIIALFGSAGGAAETMALFVGSDVTELDNDRLRGLESALVSKLASPQLRVINPRTILSAADKSLNQDRLGGRYSEAKKLLDVLRAFSTGSDVKTGSPEAYTKGAVTGLAQTVGADYFLQVRFANYIKDRRKFSGNSLAQVASIVNRHTLRVSYEVGKSSDGSIVTGDSFTVTEAWRDSASLQKDEASVIPQLLDQAVAQLCQKIRPGKIAQMPDPPDNNDVKVKVEVSMALPGGAPLQVPEYDSGALKLNIDTGAIAEIEVDGVSIGAVQPEMNLPAGLHQVSVTSAGYRPWSKFVKIRKDTRLNVALVMTQETFDYWKATLTRLEELRDRTNLNSAEVEELRARADRLRKAGIVFSFK